MQKKELKLNVGCGDNKIKGYVNIDAYKECNPDIVMNVAKRNLPYDNETVDEILFFHCIEHIEKYLHKHVLTEFARILKKDCKVYISYPDFWECARNWKVNKNGRKTFWENTLYGRQLYPGDYHVCAMDSNELTLLLYECGFKDVVTNSEAAEVYNMITIGIKGSKPVLTYEDLVAQDFRSMQVKER